MGGRHLDGLVARCWELMFRMSLLLLQDTFIKEALAINYSDSSSL